MGDRLFIVKRAFLSLICGFLFQTSFYLLAHERSAYDVHSKLLEEISLLSKRPLYSGIQWEAWDEGKDDSITRLVSPNATNLAHFVNALPLHNRQLFLKDFFTNYLNGKKSYRVFEDQRGRIIDLSLMVQDSLGRLLTLDLNRLAFKGGVEDASLNLLEEKWADWLAMTRDSPLSFLSPMAKSKLFYGDMNGLYGKGIDYTQGYRPIFGIPEKYIAKLHVDKDKQWFLELVPQENFGAFERMLTEIRNFSPLFLAPKYNRIIFKNFTSRNVPLEKVKHFVHILQLFTVLRSTARYRPVSLETFKRSLSQKHTFSFKGDHLSVTFFLGMKNIKTRRFVHTALVGRIVTNDWEGLDDLFAWNPLQGKEELSSDSIPETFKQTRRSHHFIPFWNWQQAPFLGAHKHRLIVKSKHHYVYTIKLKSTPTLLPSEEKQIFDLTADWVHEINLTEELEFYLNPRSTRKNVDDILLFRPTHFIDEKMINVNTVDLGMEYTGTFPIDNQFQVNFSGIFTLEERTSTMKKILQDVVEAFGGQHSSVEKINEKNHHGHGLGISYRGTDAQGRVWVADWDGISRNYDFKTPEYNVIASSARGGHFELVTPKFLPQSYELNVIYTIFKKYNILPIEKKGAGHINVDLAIFKNRPKGLARFLSIFHEYRGILMFLFHEMTGIHTAWPQFVNEDLQHKLKDFRGSELELKRLLYNERYFNTDLHQKTRYSALNIMDYFQDVIPDAFLLGQDFDLLHPKNQWRKYFRVHPQSRRMEMRFFEAPSGPIEAALQIRMVRAILHKSLNEDQVLSGKIQAVDYEFYEKYPHKAYEDLAQLCRYLEVGYCKDYRALLSRRINTTHIGMNHLRSRVSYRHRFPSTPSSAWGTARLWERGAVANKPQGYGSKIVMMHGHKKPLNCREKMKAFFKKK